MLSPPSALRGFEWENTRFAYYVVTRSIVTTEGPLASYLRDEWLPQYSLNHAEGGSRFHDVGGRMEKSAEGAEFLTASTSKAPFLRGEMYFPPPAKTHQTPTWEMNAPHVSFVWDVT